MVKAIFFDIDGTLISFNTHIMEKSTIEALNILRNKGIKLYIATGRHKSLVSFLDEYFIFDGYVTLNGQYTYVGDKVVHSECINKDDVRAIVQKLDKEPSSCIFVEEHETYANYLDDIMITAMENTNEAVPRIEDLHYALDRDIYQIVAFLDDDKQAEFVSCTKNCEYTRWMAMAIDIMQKGGKKSNGIEAIAKYNGISMAEVMAIGDGQNDIQMLRDVGISVAMGNAAPNVQVVADYVTTDMDNNGIYNALKHFKLI